jgi:NAD-dependent dihydropyrimidine dehydrogenase PreA subunit
MAFVIAEPCIGTKDTACVDACPVHCIHPGKMSQHLALSRSCTLIPLSASIAEPAFQRVLFPPSLPQMICQTNGSTSQRSMPDTTGTKTSRDFGALVPGAH